MPCGCKKGHGISLHGAGVRRKKGGMAISGAGYKKRKKQRRKKRKGARGGGLITASLFNPVASLASLIRKRKRGGAFSGSLGRGYKGLIGRAIAAQKRASRKGSGGRFLSGAVWHGYGKGSGMSVSGAGLYGKRLLGRGGSGRRQI
jgi:hypothetical protein